MFELPDGEAAKDFLVVERAWRVLGETGFTRTDVLVAVGGGAATDVGGFIAATWLRGIRFLNVPTTLLGMVDAAIGGKTGINTPAGKNLVGAFHDPIAVLCDLDFLGTLPPPALTSGLAEIIKCGFIADGRILDIVSLAPGDLLNPGSSLLRELVDRAIAVKLDVVRKDPTEQGLRAILNYGHTLGHAIERVENYSWQHGHAVAIGMVFAAEVGVRLGITDPALLALHRTLLTCVGLPTSYHPGQWSALSEVMRRDKKNRGAVATQPDEGPDATRAATHTSQGLVRTRMVVLRGIGKPEIVEDPDPALLENAYDALTTTEPGLSL